MIESIAIDEKANPNVGKLSVQKRSEPGLVPDKVASFVMWFNRTVNGDDVAPWWSEERDRNLRQFWRREGNDVLAGAISSMVKKFRAMNWVIEGAPRVANRYQALLSEAEFGHGWGYLLGRTLMDYLSQDKGAFWELIGTGRPDGPLRGPVLGIAHLDSAMCQLTGDVIYPVLYLNPKTGKPHKLHATRVVHLVDMPSPDEGMNGVGYCAVSRVLASSKVLLRLARYKNEKLDDLPQAGLLLLNNVLPSQWEDAKANYDRERRRMGQELWASVMVMQSLDPTQPIGADFVSFATLPDAFDERDATEIYINVVALAFGVDVREFWPMSAGPLGTAAETLVQHQKARGKGVGDVIMAIERAINWFVLPSSVTFRFDFRDDEEDAQRAEIAKLRTDTIMNMWKPDSLNAGVDPPVSRDEIRQMLADNVDEYFKEDFLQVDVTEEVSRTDEGPEEVERNTEEEEAVEEKQRDVFDGIQRNYRRRLSELFDRAIQDKGIQRAWRYFSAEFRALTKSLYPSIFMAGLAEGGISVESLEPDEQKIVDAFWKEQNDYAIKMAREFHRGRISDEQFKARAELWVNRLQDLFNLGVRSAKANQMLTWQLGPTEHCKDCARLSAQVHRAKTWQRTGWVPQANKLECGGFACQCSLIPTTDRARGRF